MTNGAEREHWSGLDGVRGIAVAAVLVYHGGFAAAQGGFLGVSLFFTLSGFLITTIVVRERESTGGISLGGFWARRGRRLLPASIVTLFLAMAATLAVVPTAQQAQAFGDVRAAALNVANWRFIWRGASYADANLVPSPVQHYWSLAIEEQFYLLFPLIAILALRRGNRRWLAAVFVAVIAVALWRQVVVSDPTRVYFGTDTRGAELALGGLLALGRHRLVGMLDRAAGPAADACGAVGLIATVMLWVAVPDTSAPLHGGGFVMVGVVSSLVVFGAVEGRQIARLLSWPVLRWLGAVSYATYLFHFPVFMLLGDGELPQGRVPQFAGGVAVTLVLAALSLRLIERPIRFGALLGARQARVALGASLTAVLVAAAVLPERYGDGPGGATFAAGLSVVVATPLPSPTIAPSTTEPSTTPGPPPTTAAPARAPHVLVVGDSTANGMAVGLREWGEDTERLRVTSVTSPGCASLVGLRFRIRDGYELAPKGCHALFGTAAATATAERVDAIVVFIGSSQLADWRYEGSDGWHSIEEGDVLASYEAALHEALSELSSAGVPVLWANLPTPRWDLDEFGRTLGGTLPGSGPVTMNDPDRARALNEADARVVPEHGLAVVWPWLEHLAGPDGTIPDDLRSDGLHVAAEHIPQMAEAWLMDLLDESYDVVVERRPDGLRPVGDHGWSR